MFLFLKTDYPEEIKSYHLKLKQEFERQEAAASVFEGLRCQRNKVAAVLMN